MKSFVPGLAALLVAACGNPTGPAGVHEEDEIEWEEPSAGVSGAPATRRATVAGWSGTWIECSDGKRIDASTFPTLRVTCTH